MLAQSHFFPQLHSLPLFIGQFLPVFLQLGLSAAKPTVQIIAARIDIRIFREIFIALSLTHMSMPAIKGAGR
jgi:hypothetical protein